MKQFLLMHPKRYFKKMFFTKPFEKDFVIGIC
jgi:hypothetical protein